MPTKKHIIIIAVLSMISLGLGYWYGMPKEEGSGGGGGNGGGGKKEPEFLKQGLVAYYPFNGNAKDESENSNDFTVKGATLTKDRHSNADRAYAFDGVDAYMEAPNHASLQLTQYTLSAWIGVNTNRLGGQFIILKDKHVGENYGLHFGGVRGMIGFYSQGYLNGSSLVKLRTQNHYPANAHFMLVGTKDNAGLKIYINGKMNAEREAKYVPDIDQQSLFLGYDGGFRYPKFCGTIDDIRIYNRALSEAEVKALYEFEKPKTQQASTATSTRQLTLEEKKLVGTYERKEGAITERLVSLDNWAMEIKHQRSGSGR